MDDVKNFKSVTILIVVSEEFRVRLIESLKLSFNKSEIKYSLSLMVCENVDEVIKMTEVLSADFVVFVMDTQLRTCVKNVEYNLQLLPKDFVCGRMCIVNGNAHIPLVKMGVSLNDINALTHKYSCTLLNADIMDTISCLHLSNRLMILITTSLGLNQKIPFLPWLF